MADEKSALKPRSDLAIEMMLPTATESARGLVMTGKLLEAHLKLLLASQAAAKASGPESPEALAAENDLGVVRFLLGRHGESEEGFRKVLAVMEKDKGKDQVQGKDQEKEKGPGSPAASDPPGTADPVGFLAPLSNLGFALNDGFKYEEATEIRRRALACAEAAFPSDPAAVAGHVANLGVSVGMRGDFEEAKALFERAVDMASGPLGPGSPYVIFANDGLGFVLARLDDQPRALEVLRANLKAATDAFGEFHPLSVTAFAHVADALGKQELRHIPKEVREEIVDLLMRAHSGAAKCYGPNSPETHAYGSELGSAVADRGDPIGGERIAQKAFSSLARLLRPADPRVRRAKTILTAIQNMRNTQRK
ncbi:MAG: tetratricopeptide repeat protein [Deltaproteobacteria bacterium]|jgi:tetratricopeptide (TPR) repeat protein|nr:tetratricopeptide repeat protein [Deltaproteobacteria bacterium]